MNVRTSALLVVLALSLGWWLTPASSPAVTQPRPRTPSRVPASVAPGPSQFVTRLRAGLGRAPGTPRTRRNPFQFATATAAVSVPSRVVPPPSIIAPVISEPPPPMTLAGIGASNTPAGIVRTAVISAHGQVWLVTAGDELPPGLHVLRVEEDHVVLVDALGAETTLRLK